MDYTGKLGGLANKLKTEKPKIHIQEVSPVKTSEKAECKESQLSTWIPTTLYKDMKRTALEEDLSIKEITVLAIEAFLKK